MDIYQPVPLPIKGNEDLEVDAANSAATSTNCYCLLWVSDGYIPLPQGPRYTIRGVGSTTLTAGAWSQVSSITWDSTLTQGKYALVGLKGVSATGLALRANVLGQYNRGGVPCFASVGQRHNDFIEGGGLGSFGQFNSFSIPTIEFLATSADTAQTIFLEVVKVG